MRASHLAGAVAVALLVVTVAAGPAAAQVDESNEGAICDGAPGSGDSLVLVLPDGTYVHADETVTLLPGTEADIALCSGGELISTSAWPVDDSVAGVTVTGTTEFSYGITVETVSERTPVEFAPAINNRGEVATPTVTATPGGVTTARLGGDRYQIALGDGQERRFERANESYVTTLAEMRSAAENLNRTAERSRLSADSNTTERWVANINQTRAVRTNYTTIQSVLFSSARNGDANAAEALDGYAAYHDRMLRGVEDDLRSANGAIAQQARSAALGVLANFLGVALVGAVVGGLGGRFVTNRILSKVEGQRRRSSAVDFRPRHVAGQLLAGLVLLGAAVALLVLQGLLDPLVAVVGAVIGL